MRECLHQSKPATLTGGRHGFLNQQEAFVKVVILGCGRVGATLATQLDQAGHSVSIIDSSSDAFQRLSSKFKGNKIVGNGAQEDVLRRAGIETADAFAAVTNGDNRNILASQIAKEIFHIKKVVCRIYDPLRQRTFGELGLEAVCPTTVVADMLLDSLSGIR
jgi:trk system potassium uptake protein TrkA